MTKPNVPNVTLGEKYIARGFLSYEINSQFVLRVIHITERSIAFDNEDGYIFVYDWKNQEKFDALYAKWEERVNTGYTLFYDNTYDNVFLCKDSSIEVYATGIKNGRFVEIGKLTHSHFKNDKHTILLKEPQDD